MRPDDPAEVPLEPVAPRPAVVEQPDVPATLASLECLAFRRSGVVRALGVGEHQQQALRLGLAARGGEKVVEMFHAWTAIRGCAV